MTSRIMRDRRHIVVLGRSLSTSWDSGQATTFRALLRALFHRGHDITFFERAAQVPAEYRDLTHPSFCDLHEYGSLDELAERFGELLTRADIILVGSDVQEGIAAAEMALSLSRGICVFFDMQTPVTLANLQRGMCDYLSLDLVRRFDVYLSSTGGPILMILGRIYHARMVRAFYCCVEEQVERPTAGAIPRWALGFLGRYTADRQPPLRRYMFETAAQCPSRRFVVAGEGYPQDVRWPDNVDYIQHVPPARHRSFFANVQFALNLTRADMRVAGYSPSVRMFEAAMHGTPLISDTWPGQDEFFHHSSEILTVTSSSEVIEIIQASTVEQRTNLAAAAKCRVLAHHTGMHRAEQFEQIVETTFDRKRLPARSMRR